MKVKKKNKLYFVILCILFVSIGLGYAYLSTSLGVNIGVKVTKRRIVYFDSVRVVDGSVTATKAPAVDKHSTYLDFTVTLSKSSDIYSFYIDVKNDTIKKMMINQISTAGLTSAQESLIDFQILYADESIPKVNDMLLDDTDTLKVIVKVKDGVTSFSSQQLNLALEVMYKLADENTMFSPYYYMANGAVDDVNVNFQNSASSTNGLGLNIANETINDEFPVYYYRGNVTDNNVLFNGKCWKIIRTTDTRGTKLLFAGEPNASGGCTNTGDSTFDVSSKFNNKYTLESVGYMYDGDTEVNKKGQFIYNLYNTTTISSSFQIYYSSSVNSNLRITSGQSFSSSNVSPGSSLSGVSSCFYHLNNMGVASSISSGYVYSSSTPLAKTKTSVTTCSNFTPVTIYRNSFNLLTLMNPSYYVLNASSSGSSIQLTQLPMSSYNSYIYFGDSYEIDENGKYNLVDVSNMYMRNWYTSSSRSSYVGKYICSTPTKSSSCDTIVRVYSVGATALYGTEESIKFGNSVTYADGVYTLVDTIDDYRNNYNLIKERYHYTCLGGETCSEVAYITEAQNNTTFYYIMLSNGDVVNDAYMNKVFSNSNDSTIKGVVDEWYTTNLSNVTNEIEDTVYCNDRSLATGSFLGYNVEANASYFGGYNRLEVDYKPSYVCPLKRDSFTINDDVGNGDLVYPIGLITADEYLRAGEGGSYLSTGSFWTMSPAKISSEYQYLFYGSSNYIYHNSTSVASRGVRPVISLKYGVKFRGSGTTSSPFVVLSKFNIAGNSYTYIPGMTWEEWISSEYNTTSLSVTSDNMLCENGVKCVVGPDCIESTSQINSSINYSLTSGSVSCTAD